jgi:nucleoside phosphorylase/tetratricopeptide (TPR) repeat protein
VNQGDERRVDVVILTAIRLEFDAVLQVHAGAVPGSSWETVPGPSGLPVAYRSFMVRSGRPPLRVAVAVAPDMGATAAIHTLLPLVDRLAPRCIAMCGVCAGPRDKVRLGDIIAADRLFYHDTGKQRRGRIQQDLTTYKLRDDWKAALERMDVVTLFGEEPWFQARPLTTESRLHRALVALRDLAPAPWDAVDPAAGGVKEWPLIVAALRERRLLTASGATLTKAGRRFVEDLLFRHRGTVPDLSPMGTLQPLRLHVAPIGSGTRVIEDERIWSFVSQGMRKALGIEMEAAAIGELAHRQRQHKLDWVVMKGVMDFADHGRDDHFKEFAARASAECLLWFLREHMPTELAAGFDDLLTPGTALLPNRVHAPSVLLNARYAVVPWYEAGRSEILAELDDWADDPSLDVAVRLLHAEGGIGKTRLTIEWIQRRRARYDVAGFLASDPDRRWLERLCDLGPAVVVVIDYAESRADLVSVIQRVVDFGASAGPRRRLRVLLLARSDGDWWRTLLGRSPAIAALLERHPPRKLSPLAATPADRESVFVAASRAFAQIRRRSPALRSPIPLDDVRFQRVLYLHAAALAAMEGLHAEPRSGASSVVAQSSFDAGSVMDELLAHEERFWVREANDRSGASIDLPLARQMVAAATLRGGLTTWEDACDTCERLVRRSRSRADDALIALLHDIYDGGDRAAYLPGLEPDLLGEGIVLRIAAPSRSAGMPDGDTWIDRVIAPDDDARAITATFTALGRASVTNAAAVRPWIVRLLRTRLAQRALPALQAAKAVGKQTVSSTMGDLLADALEQDGSIAIAFALAEERIPYPTVSLRRVAEWQSRMQLAYAPTGYDDDSLELRARWLLERARRLDAMERHEPALAATREAVELYRLLAARDPDAFRAPLAASLIQLGISLGAFGRHDAAAVATREAVDFYRSAVAHPHEFQPNLAAGLNNLGRDLSVLGQREPALAAVREAVDFYRLLAASDPDAFLPNLATSLLSLGRIMRDGGEGEPAIPPIREAVDILRRLAAHSPDAFLPNLAAGLLYLGSVLRARAPARAATQEAVDVLRVLAARDPDGFEPELAKGLMSLGARWSELGQRELALAASREALDVNRALAARKPDVCLPDLATTLHNFSILMGNLGQGEPALAAGLEAVQLYRGLVARDADRFLANLAASLDNVAYWFREIGEYKAARHAIQEAAAIRRARRPLAQP